MREPDRLDGLSFAVMATMTSGKTSRMPKTAISTPTVRKIFCQKAFILLRMPALTTALSNDSEISRTARIATIAESLATPRGCRPGKAGDSDAERPAEGSEEHVLPTQSLVIP